MKRVAFVESAVGAMVSGRACSLSAYFDRPVNTETQTGTMDKAAGSHTLRVPMPIALTGERRIIIGPLRRWPSY